MMSISRSEAGEFKEVIASIKGSNISSTLKYESGVHRVQRVPDTQTQGRVLTSAVTVAVLPEAEEVDLKINEADKKNAIIEIRAGTGGLEASLFASDLFRMYEKVSSRKKWTLELISISKSEAGGLKEVIASIKGKKIDST